MCIAVPACVIELCDDELFVCRIGSGGVRLTASAALLPDPLQVGDYVIIHAGFALKRLSAEDAAETFRLLQEMAASDAVR